MPVDLTPAIGRINDLCNLFHAVARTSEQRGWPDATKHAAATLARELEQLAGEIDGAGDEYQILAAAEVARRNLPAAFRAFGQAVAETLLANAGIRRPRRETLDRGAR
jgi:hypothetical protein